MFFPSIIEKWTVIIDCREFPKSVIFAKDDLLFLLDDLAEHFVFCLEKILLIEPTYDIIVFLRSIQGY